MMSQSTQVGRGSSSYISGPTCLGYGVTVHSSWKGFFKQVLKSTLSGEWSHSPLKLEGVLQVKPRT